jgi:hypothetical protein
MCELLLEIPPGTRWLSETGSIRNNPSRHPFSRCGP